MNNTKNITRLSHESQLYELQARTPIACGNTLTAGGHRQKPVLPQDRLDVVRYLCKRLNFKSKILPSIEVFPRRLQGGCLGTLDLFEWAQSLEEKLQNPYKSFSKALSRSLEGPDKLIGLFAIFG